MQRPLPDHQNTKFWRYTNINLLIISSQTSIWKWPSKEQKWFFFSFFEWNFKIAIQLHYSWEDDCICNFRSSPVFFRVTVFLLRKVLEIPRSIYRVCLFSVKLILLTYFISFTEPPPLPLKIHLGSRSEIHLSPPSLAPRSLPLRKRDWTNFKKMDLEKFRENFRNTLGMCERWASNKFRPGGVNLKFVLPNFKI